MRVGDEPMIGDLSCVCEAPFLVSRMFVAQIAVQHVLRHGKEYDVHCVALAAL